MNFTSIRTIFIWDCDEIQIVQPILNIPRDGPPHQYYYRVGLGVIGGESSIVSCGIEKDFHIGKFSDRITGLATTPALDFLLTAIACRSIEPKVFCKILVIWWWINQNDKSKDNDEFEHLTRKLNYYVWSKLCAIQLKTHDITTSVCKLILKKRAMLIYVL